MTSNEIIEHGNEVETYLASHIGKYITNWFDAQKIRLDVQLRKPNGDTPTDRNSLRDEASGALDLLDQFRAMLESALVQRRLELT